MSHSGKHGQDFSLAVPGAVAAEEISAVRVVKLDLAGDLEVKPFKATDLQTRKSSVVAKGGIEASKYTARALSGDSAVKVPPSPMAPPRTVAGARPQDERFRINPAVRERLSVAEEERRQMAAAVEARVSELTARAREEGFAQGVAQGHEAGREEALSEFRAAAQSRLLRLDEFMRGLEGLKDELYAAHERLLGEVVFKIARAVTLKELSADREYLQRLVRTLLEKTDGRGCIRIKVSPKDASDLELARHGAKEALGTLKNVHIEVSEDVAGGGCRIETDWNYMDAAVDTQLARLHDALLGSGPEVPSSAQASEVDQARSAVAGSDEKGAS